MVEELKKDKLTVEIIKEDLIEEYGILTDNFTNKDRIDKIVDILREEAQTDASQIQDGTLNFEQMIMQEGFIAVNFDLWILLNRYKIPSIFISSKPIPETRFNKNEFVCYKRDTSTEKYMFIVTPAMYKRAIQKIPEYRVIVNDKSNVEIDLEDLKDTTCLSGIELAIDEYVTIEDYLDIVFEKDVTTKYKPRKRGLREGEYEVDEEREEGREEEKEKEEAIPVTKKIPVKKLKGKKIAPTLILEEAEEAIGDEIQPNILTGQNDIINDILEEEPFEIVPIKKRKTRNVREKKIKVNPQGKTGRKTKKLLSSNIEIGEELEIVN
jgi:hypothetical protein